MPYRRIPFEIGAAYHVFNRGVARQATFFHADHYAFFRQRLSDLILPTASLIALCQMPNHYHMVVRIREDGFSEAMKRFALSFVKAVNKSQGRAGPLFQSRFRAIRVHDDRYLASLIDYVHRNPITAGIADSPDEWDHSSYRAYEKLGLAMPDLFLTQSMRGMAFEWPSLTLADFTSPGSKKTGKNVT
ncbi:MAG: transposase [Chloroflexi bacterium]|nr:transposase [Chloroflexota bacterium]